MIIVYTGQGGTTGALLSAALFAVTWAFQYLRPRELAFLVMGIGLGLGVLAMQRGLPSLSRFFASPPSRLDAVLSRLRSMPTVRWWPASELSIRELRDSVRGTFIERSELETAYNEAWDDVCAICAESWQPGDVCRRLAKCRHAFHLECIDRWALTSADKGRLPLCPLCKAEF